MPARFVTWIFILLSLTVGAVLWWRFQGKNEGQAAVTMNASKVNVQATNLIGYWTFDGADTSSTTATDRGGANNGTITEAVGKPGKIGQALDFDGANDKVAMGDVLDRGDTDDLTLSGWFRRDTSDTDDTVLAKRNGVADTDDGYILYLDDATDQLIFEVSEIGGSDEYQLASTSTFTTTDWYHIVVVWDQDSAANSEIYINGVDDNATDTGTIGNIGDLTTALALTVGEETDNGNPFDGRLDDVRVYSNAFSATQVADLYTVANAAKVVNAGMDDMMTNGLVGYWTFDGNDTDWSDTGTEIKDVSGNNNHGAINGLTRSSVRSGKLGQGLSFTYNSTEAIDLGSEASLDDLVQKTLCAWMYPRSYGVSADDAVIFNKDNVGGWSLMLADDNGPTNALYFFQATWSGGLGKWRTGSSSITLNTWQHICVAYDRSSASNDPVMYINATPVSVTEYSTPSGSYVSEASNILYLGNWDTSSASSFDGSLDDVRIYNRLLSSAEVTDLYNMGR